MTETICTGPTTSQPALNQPSLFPSYDGRGSQTHQTIQEPLKRLKGNLQNQSLESGVMPWPPAAAQLRPSWKGIGCWDVCGQPAGSNNKESCQRDEWSTAEQSVVAAEQRGEAQDGFCGSGGRWL
ncbi:unnamed protein product [Boreogadus saida]